MTRLILLILYWLLIYSVQAVMEEVVILEQPQSGHVVKSRTYHLSCKALNAKKIRFKCNEKWLDDSRLESVLGTDSSSQLPYLEGSVELTRQEVDNSAHFEDFTCECYASGSSDQHVVRSDSARIRVAYMRKHFVQSPTGQRVPEGTTVQLPCISPESDPRATITWEKDGLELERSMDSNLIYGNDGSLIISATRLSDSGNYTCVATNIANRRATDTVTLNVYVNGDWSQWSQWSGGCQTNCDLLRLQLEAAPSHDVLPKLRRRRTCNNPPPLNGGAYCIGEDEEYRACDIPCRVDGRWSNWTEWSACSPSCHRFRTRTCSLPPPLNGGSPCRGRDLDTAPCNQGYCQPVSPSSLSTDAALYGGFACVAVLLFIIIGLCSALLCRRNKGKKANANSIYYAESGAHVRRVLLDQKTALLDDDPQKIAALGSQFFTLASTCSPSPLHPSFTLRSAKSGYSGYSANNRNVGSRAALITECSSSNSSSGGKNTVVRTSSNCSDDEPDDNYATLYDYMEQKTVGGLESSQAVLAAQVDYAGARLQLRKSGASLLIPENAVDHERMVYLAVSDQVADRPVLKPHESALSPVVVFGTCESDVRPLQKPIIVSFRHCASVFPRDNWVFTIYADEGFGWQPAVTVGEENLNTTMHVYMEPSGKSVDGLGWCHVMTETFARLILVGRARRSSVSACKRVHLAAYGPATRPEGSFEMRIYCVPETGAAMESVTRQEENGRLLAESEHFMLNEKGSLCFCVEDISDGFQLRGPALVEIPDSHHQWCSQNGLHCSIPIDSIDNRRSIEEFAARLVVYQKTNSSERHLLQVRFENSIYDRPPCEEDDKVVTADFHLPADVKEELAVLLDPPTEAERDWRGLARKLRYDRYIQYFGTRPGCSPTVLLLSLWEAAERGSIRAKHDLLQSLRVMGRPDAVLVLEQYLATFSYVMSP